MNQPFKMSIRARSGHSRKLSHVKKSSLPERSGRLKDLRRAAESAIWSTAGRALHNQGLPPACLRCLPLIMDKLLLQQQVLKRLAEDLLQAEQAVRAAMKRRLTKKTLPKTNTTHWDSKPPTWPPAKFGAPKPSAKRWPTGANYARVPTTSEKVYSSARWSTWSIPTTSSNTSFSARMGAA